MGEHGYSYCVEGLALQHQAIAAGIAASRLAMAWTRERGLGTPYGAEVGTAYDAEHAAFAAFAQHVECCKAEGGCE